MDQKINNFPVVFTNGKDVYEQLAQTYITHDFGLFILAPSGAGKTHFCKNQKEPHWIDGDELWIKAGAHPDGPWWTGGLELIHEIDERSDVITVQAKKQGFWIMGASNRWLKPDAVVLPDWETHKKLIIHREQNNYDGGAKSDAFDQVLSHREVIEKWHTDHGVPKFETIAAAVEALTPTL